MMGALTPFLPEKLVIPTLISDGVRIDTIVDDLASRYGAVDFVSPAIPFSFTRYYEAEMGAGLTRYILSFERLIDPALLSNIKRETNDIESGYARTGFRTVNLDPGLISLRRLILASTKDNGRRIPLCEGIYAEITLVFHHGDFHPIEWTYPDYRSREYRSVFCAVREVYRDQLKHQIPEPSI